MHTYKGIVCEINKNYMIFMTTEGEFLRGVPKQTNPQIGDEVEFQLLATSPLFKKKFKSYIIGPTLVAAILLIFFVTTLFPYTKSAYAYVQIGENIEISIDEQGNVISVNKTKKIDKNPLKGLELEGLPIEVALTKAIDVLSSDPEKLIITTKFNDKNPSETNEKIKNAVNEVQSKKNENSINKKENTESKNKGNENSSLKNQNSSIKEQDQNNNNSSKSQNHYPKNNVQTNQHKSKYNGNHNGNYQEKGKNNQNKDYNKGTNNKNSNNQNDNKNKNKDPYKQNSN